MTFATLFHRFIVRDMALNPGRTLLTLLGVALGIAVVVAVGAANDRAIGSFNDSLALLSGGADLQIAANGLDLDETLIGELAWVWDVGAMTAVLEGRVEADLPTGSEQLTLMGIDLLSDAPFRTYTLAEETDRDLALDITREAFVDLLVEPEAIVIPAALARDFGVGAGDSVELLVANRLRGFRVASILEDSGVAGAFGGRIVFMDIAAAQWALGRLGAIDRIDISLDDPSDAEEVAERLRFQLPPSVLVYRPSDTTSDTLRMTRAFRYNLTALSYIALVVAVVLIYNTLNMAVTRRRVEIAALRTLGLEGRTIERMFLLQAVAFGVAGGLLGIQIGVLLADIAGALVSGTISAIYTGRPVAVPGSGVNGIVYLEMIVLGGALAAVSGLGPARRAMAVPPVEALRFGEPSPPQARAGMGAGLLVLGALLCFAPPIGDFPFLGYGAGVSFIAGFGLLTPHLAGWMLPGLRRMSVAVFPAEGRLAIHTIEARLGRIAAAVMSLAIAVAMLISVAIMVASFRQTVVVWIDQTLEGDLYLRPATSGGDPGNVLDTRLVDALDSVSQIGAIDRFRATGVNYEGFPSIVASADFETIALYSRLLFKSDDEIRGVAARVIGRDSVIVSEPFAVRHDIGKGDTLTLPTPGGIQAFAVEAVFYDYSSEGGMVVMDRATWIERFGDTSVSSIAVYLNPGANIDEARRAIALAVPDAGVRIATNRELKDQVLRVFDQTFEVTFALEVIALAVAMLGIANTLAALIFERRPELAMLRFVGASRSQVRRVAIVEAGLVGVLGSLIGLALGFVLSMLLVYVINFQSFGWTIQLDVPVGFLVQSIAVVLASTLAAGLYPAALALRIDPIRAIRAE